MNEITTTRSNPLVDPALHVWNAEIPLYLFLGGLVAGLMVLAGISRLRGPRMNSHGIALVPWMAPVLLTVGMLALWLDLENRWNVLRFYLAMRPTSPMSWGSWILLLVYPASILVAWVTTPPSVRVALLQRVTRGKRVVEALDRWSLVHERAIGWASVVVGASLGIYTGVLLGTMAARPLWNSAVLGPLFLVSGMSGAAAFLLLHTIGDAERVAIGRLDLGLILVEFLLLALWLIGLGTGSADARAAAGLLLGGPYTAAFWTLVIVGGLVTPLVAELIEIRHKLLPGRVAAALVLLGGFALRWIVVFAGQDSAILARTALH